MINRATVLKRYECGHREFAGWSTSTIVEKPTIDCKGLCTMCRPKQPALTEWNYQRQDWETP